MTANDQRTGVAVLGSTGSVGRQTLDVLSLMSDQFRVVALAAGNNYQLLAEQVRRVHTDYVALDAAPPADSDLPGTLGVGPEGLMAAATHPEADVVVVATSGHAAIDPTFAAVAAGKTIVLANKETIVCAGELIMPFAREHGVEIRPADSEHSAIWQCLQAAPKANISRLIVTASGGPFRGATLEQLRTVTAADALSHPTWSMGNKITIDSATLMNKGLEVIEARWLFDVPYRQIDVVVHPESIVHSLVEFVDGSHLAQLGLPDMKLPIQYALTSPNRSPNPWPRLSLTEIGSLHFEPPDLTRFPALALARQAGEAGSTYPTVLSSADEIAVAEFLSGRLTFLDIAAVISDVLDHHSAPSTLTREAITEADDWARRFTADLIDQRQS
jgi:1-deoxy-D-xylulose-5-phosphate reductoisomerase